MASEVCKDQDGPILIGSDGFTAWLLENECSLVFASPDRERVFFIGMNGDGSLWAHERHVDGCKCVSATPDELWVATTYQLWRFRNVIPAGRAHRDTGADRLYCPRISYVTGALFIHEVAAADTDRPCFVNTQYSCLAEPDSLASFNPIWRPQFVSSLSPDDRCHLNGMAHTDGKPRFVSARGRYDTPFGWRDRQATGGLVIDVDSNEIVSDRLSMPHSPRYHDGVLYVLNTGTCEFGRVDIDSGRFEPICFCPGYARGLAIHRNFAIIGVSLSRTNELFEGLPLHNALRHADATANCRILIVDMTTGRPAHWLWFRHTVREIASVDVIPGVRQPAMLGFQDEERLSRTISLRAAA